jgi:hypothetical protein
MGGRSDPTYRDLGFAAVDDTSLVGQDARQLRAYAKLLPGGISQSTFSSTPTASAANSEVSASSVERPYPSWFWRPATPAPC